MANNEIKGPANINFSDSGKGKTIVLLHGFLESSGIWDDFTDKLSESFRVITIDLPGHGKSDCIAEEHSMEIMAEEVKNILEILGIKKVLLIGHSMGGYVSAAFAEKYPGMLKGLILFHSHAFADDDEAKKNRDRFILAVNNDHIDFIKNFIPELFAPDNRSKYHKEIIQLINMATLSSKEGVIAALKGMKNRKDRNKVIANLEIPVLYIIGKYDPRTPQKKIFPVVEKSKNAVVVVLENSGHMGYIEEKDNSFELIKDFAESVL